MWVQTIPLKETCQQSTSLLFDDFRNRVVSFKNYMSATFVPILMVISGVKTVLFMWSFIEVAKAVQVHGPGGTTTVFNVGFTFGFITLHAAHEFVMMPYYGYIQYLKEDFMKGIYSKQDECTVYKLLDPTAVEYVIDKTAESVQMTKFMNYISIVFFILTIIGCIVVTIMTKIEDKKNLQIELE